MPYTPNDENITVDNAQKTVFHYCDDKSIPIFLARELFKKQAKLIIHPYYANRTTGAIRQPRVTTIEFLGWTRFEDLPDEFKKHIKGSTYYGIHSKVLKEFLAPIIRKLPRLNKIVFGASVKTRFSEKTVTINWNTVDRILTEIKKENAYYAKNKRFLINNEIAALTTKFSPQTKEIYANELKAFIGKFDGFGRMTDDDTEALSKVLEVLPKSKISVTSNFIKTKDKINIAYLEDIISEFEKLMKIDIDNEKKWQLFFEVHSWVFSHLFPYDVILRQKEAYVGGKTIANKDGKVVDFLLSNGFKDNYALIEIKTHKKALLGKTAYRGTDVFTMSDDLSGGINQCLDQKDNFLKEFGKTENPIDPKCILVIGRKNELLPDQTKCFELLRANQKNVDIITFDELLAKLKGLLKVLKN
ncbi:MAG: hypothetical protein BGO69_14670 [Bacteroidetes bacterium 46-16]|nr:MAG: hypothetical protein BGO69_14670 [Bacteroidetes bacterium 46-16]